MLWLIIELSLLIWVLALAAHVGGNFAHLILLVGLFAAIAKLVQLRRDRRNVKGLPKKPAPLFLTEFEVSPTWDFPENFVIKEWAGLVLCQLIGRGTTGARLLAWWDDGPESYNDYWASRLRTTLALSDPVFRGVLVRHKSNEENAWEKLAKNPWFIITIFTGAVALLTNVTQFKNFVDWAFATPDTGLFVPASSTPMVVGEPRVLTLTANNRASSDCELVIEPPQQMLNEKPLLPDKSLEILEKTARSWKLPQGGTVPLTFTLIGKEANTYKIRISGKQHSGQLRGWDTLPTVDLNVDVWWPIDQKPSVTGVWPAPDGSAVFTVIARHGHPPARAIQYYAELTGDDLSFVGVSPGTITHNLNSGGDAVLTWDASAEPSPRPQQFSITVKGKGTRNENDWKTLTSQLQVVAQ